MVVEDVDTGGADHSIAECRASKIRDMSEDSVTPEYHTRGTVVSNSRTARRWSVFH